MIANSTLCLVFGLIVLVSLIGLGWVILAKPIFTDAKKELTMKKQMHAWSLLLCRLDTLWAIETNIVTSFLSA